LPRALLAAIAALTGLVTAGSAAAHIVALPAFVPSGSSESVTFSGPNERDFPMTGFALVVPAGLEIAHAHEIDGWDESIDGKTATWLGGPLAPNEEVGFGITLDADVEPGVVELQAVQRYADGNEVSWPVSLTITPAEESPSQNLALAGIVGLIGVLLVVAVGMLAWRRRSP
jgi:hypothetical protein